MQSRLRLQMALDATGVDSSVDMTYWSLHMTRTAARAVRVSDTNTTLG